MIETKKMKTIFALFVMIAMLLPAILLAGCDPGQEGIIDDGDAEIVQPDGQTEEDFPLEGSDGIVDDDPVDEEDEVEYVDIDTADITGTYIGEAIATEAEYYKVKQSLFFEMIEVGTVKDFTLTVILDETTGKYYTNGVLAEKTELPNGDIYLESIDEYEGSMSKKSTLSFHFVNGEKEIAGTMTDITFVYGAIAAREVWRINVGLIGDNE